MKISSPRFQGFTLVELAVVMVIIGIVMTMGLRMVMATLENAAYSETKGKQEYIKVALIGYLRTNGKLPCPDNLATPATGVAAATCTTNEQESYGVVPWGTLGIPRDAVLDGWGNYFTYKVANGRPVGAVATRNWTSKAAPASDFTVNELTAPTPALTIQELNAAGDTLITATDKAVAVILSHGSNGYGAKTTKVAARLPTTDAGAGEATNSANATTTFVRRPVNQEPAAFNGPYDDVLAYLTPQDLLQPLVSEGSLKACVAYCPNSAASATCSSGGGQCACPSGPGFPGADVSCTAGGGACGTCTSSPTAAGCSPTPPIPVGAIPATCI